MQLLGSSKKEIDHDEDGQLVPKIENDDVVLIHCNVVNNTLNQNLEYCILLYQLNNLVNQLMLNPNDP